MGALDLGGASTQITFVPGGPVQDESTQATFRLYGFEHSIYTRSYLCFGRDEVLSRLLAGLVQVGSPGTRDLLAEPPTPWQVLRATSRPLCRAAPPAWSATPATTAATRTHCPWPTCSSRLVCRPQPPNTCPRT